MPKKPKPLPAPQHSVIRRSVVHLWSVTKHNPFSSIAAIVGIFVGIPGVVSATVYLSGAMEPKWYASHEWVREWGAPIIKVQNTQALSIDRFILFQQQNAIANIKTDPAYHTSPVVQERAKELDSQIKDTESRICKATGKSRDCK